MPKRHPPEVRAAAVAAVASGEMAAEVARRFGISPGRLSDWCRVDGPTIPERSGIQYTRTRERMAELIYDCLVDSLSAIRLQLQAASRDEWLEKQTARDLAALLDREFDGAIRLLAGFKPATDDQRALDEPDIVDVEPAGVGDPERRAGDAEPGDSPL